MQGISENTFGRFGARRILKEKRQQAMNELGGKRLAQASERQWGYDDLRLVTKACSEFLKEK